MLGEWGTAYSAIPTLNQEMQNREGKGGSGKKMEIKIQFSIVDSYYALTLCWKVSAQRTKSFDDLDSQKVSTTQPQLLCETLSQIFLIKIWKNCSVFCVLVCGFIISVWFGLVCFLKCDRVSCSL